MARKYVYTFEHADEYEEIAPCKICGSRPYSSIAGIFCKVCGYEVGRFGRTSGQVVAEWNAVPDEGERAPVACDVAIV